MHIIFKLHRLHDQRMKISRLLPLTLLLLLAIPLSACVGGASAATSWPGVSVNESQQSAYLAYNQQIYAINLQNGTEKWRFPEKADSKMTFFAAPVLTVDGRLVAAGYDHVLHLLDPQNNGQEVHVGNWPFAGAENRYIASPLVVGENIYAPNSDATLYALDKDANLLWKFKAKQPLWATPASDGQTIYLPSMDHHIYALDAQSGNLLWQTEDLGGAVVGRPTLGADGVLYAGTFGHEMVALDTHNGQVLWSFPTQGWVWGGPALDGNSLYFGDLDGAFYAVNAGDKSVLWQHPPEAESSLAISDTPLVLQGVVYYTSEDGTLYAVNAANGQQVWKQALGGKLYGSPVLSGDLILAAPVGADALLVALDTNGAQKWTYTPPKQ
jgi:outer membrane protein assembly factor BamB